jgi:translation elongation factor EF-Tu-like GTPase
MVAWSFVTAVARYPVLRGEATLVNEPPMDAVGPQLWMVVDDVFHIRGRGTVVTGQLQGDGQLSTGDTLLCDDGQRWQVSGIEQFRAVLMTAEPGWNIGVLLSAGPAPDLLRGRRVWFEPSAAGMNIPFMAGPRRKKRWRG